jgi:hypothetical protein
MRTVSSPWATRIWAGGHPSTRPDLALQLLISPVARSIELISAVVSVPELHGVVPRAMAQAEVGREPHVLRGRAHQPPRRGTHSAPSRIRRALLLLVGVAAEAFSVARRPDLVAAWRPIPDDLRARTVK